MNKIDAGLTHLKNYLDRLIQPPKEEWRIFSDYLRFTELSKDQFFFKQGEKVSEIGFIIQGLIVNYYTNSEGDEFVKKFSVPGNPIACYKSLILGREANYSARALETTAFFSIPYNRLQELYERHCCWERLGRLNAERIYMEKEFREEQFLISEAKVRYEHFCSQFPDLAEKVPQYLIASYIGITPASLSRPKKEI